jgi:hypothetical protein
MKNNLNRRDFVKTAAIGGISLGLSGNMAGIYGKNSKAAANKIGIIGLDTSHSVAYTKALNSPDAGPEFGGF